ncbi:MAG: Do family serine endopeptidase [Sulfurospirillum sp.]|nr:Do family serine endopeptidase [Sulfurospirillum sp.]
MKKITFLSIFTTSLLIAGSFNIQEAPNNSQREIATQKNIILSYHDSIKDARKSVVNIATTTQIKEQRNVNPFLNDPFFKEFFGDRFGNGFPQQKRRSSSLGSGVIISNDGYIITNNHVVENADEIVVTLLDNEKEYKAKVVGLDSKTDLAIIKIDAKDLRAIAFGNSDETLEGDVVFAIGNPFGVGGTITQGIVSALNKSGIGLNQYENFIQTDASINPGNSGGALVDSRGALVGINSAILSRSGGNNGIGFAIPANMAKKVATSLIEDGKIERGYLGVTIADLSNDLKEIYKNDHGAFIMSVEANSPAAKAGLKRGDLILSIDNQKVKNANDLKNIIGNKKPNAQVSVEYEDANNKVKSAKLKLSNLEKGKNSLKTGDNEFLDGLLLEELDAQTRYRYQMPNTLKGVLIVDIKEGSKASKNGFAAGDIITQIDSIIIENLEDIQKALSSQKRDRKIVYIKRNGRDLVVVVK